MTPNSLFPAFVVLDYTTAFGAHKMTIPTLEWRGETSVGGDGIFANWSTGTEDAAAMILELVDVLKALWPSTTTIHQYTIYSQASPTSAPFPVAVTALTTVGTNVSTAWAKAVQTTLNFKTEGFHPFKIVALDSPTASFNKINRFDAPGEATAIRDVLIDSGNGWSGRDNQRIAVLESVTYTLNEKLRRAYHMG